jgi:dienelactone hydrolase
MFDTVSVPTGATAGVLLIHGGTGRGDHERERGDRLAALGYAVHAPDLFGGPPTREAIVALAGDPTELRRRVVAAWQRLAEAVPITFAVGHCFGGLAALELARAGTEVRAVVSLHGGLATSAPAAAIGARVLAVCGAADAFCPREQRAAFEAEMTAAGADWQLLVLGGAQHGFSVPGIARPACAYDTVADRRSWRAMLALFEDTMTA